MTTIEAVSVEATAGLEVIGYTFTATCRLCASSVRHEHISEGHAGTMVFTARCTSCDAVNAYRVEAFVLTQPTRRTYDARNGRVWGRVLATGRVVRVIDSDPDGWTVRVTRSSQPFRVPLDGLEVLAEEEGSAA